MVKMMTSEVVEIEFQEVKKTAAKKTVKKVEKKVEKKPEDKPLPKKTDIAEGLYEIGDEFDDEDKNLIIRPALHPAQKHILKTMQQFNVVNCARRWGKTEFDKYILCFGPKGLLAGYPCAYATPVESTFTEMWDAMIEMLRPLIRKVNAQKKVIWLKNKARLDFHSLAGKVSGRGKRYGTLIVDEAAFDPKLREHLNKALMPTLADWNGNLWCTSSPNGFNYFRDLYLLGQDNVEFPLWMSWKFPTLSNPYISIEYVKNEEKRLSSPEFRQEYLAEFVSEGGNYINRTDHIRYGTPLIGYGQSLDVSIGVDLAASQRTSSDFNTLVATTKRDGLIYVLEAIKIKDLPNQVKQQMYMFFDKWRPKHIYIESVAYQVYGINDLVQNGKASYPIRSIKPQDYGDKWTRFMPVLGKYEHNMMVHDPAIKMSDFEEELINFDGKDRKDRHDDFVDALVYSVLGLDEIENEDRPVGYQFDFV